MNRSARHRFLISILLALVTLAVYWPVRHMEFINYDDPGYISDQPLVRHGLTKDGLAWAFSTWYTGNWYPLTWLSFMLDAQLFGTGPAAFHTTNLLFHAADSVLLFLLFCRLTGSLWRSAFVAALFAVHPMHVESVAWVAERKDVLSGFFFMLALLSWARFVQGKTLPAVQPDDRSELFTGPWPSTLSYALSLLFFTLGLLSKPMLVTLPFVLLLLDYWPLQRWKMDPGISPTVTLPRLFRAFIPPGNLLVEKLPFFLLSAASCVVTFFALKTNGIPHTLVHVPMAGRIENGLVSYARYLGKLFWPVDLAVMYPDPGRWPRALVALSLLLVAGLCYGAFRLRRRLPFALTGWFWFVGMLIPVIGLVQGPGFQTLEDRGFQCMADRYTYLPAIGVFIVLAWSVGGTFVRRRFWGTVIGVVAGLAVAACAARTENQLRHWRNSECLFRHALGVTENNFLAHNNLGKALFDKGNLDEAMTQFREALEIVPRHPMARNNLGFTLLKKGQTDQAIAQIRKALEVAPDFTLAQQSLGLALLRKGELEEAIAHFQEAVQLQPDDTTANYNLGTAFLRKGRLDDAINCFETALKIDPDYAAAHIFLGRALFQKGRLDQAIVHFQKLLAIEPRNMEILNDLAWVLATSPEASVRDGAKAVELAVQADRLSGSTNPAVVDTLAAAYAEARRFPEAIAAAERALQLVSPQNNAAKSAALKTRIEWYQAGSPFRNASATNSPAFHDQP